MTLLSSSENFEVQYLMGVVKIATPGQKNPKQMWLLGAWLLYWLLFLAILLILGSQAVYAYKTRGVNIFSILLGFAVFFGLITWGMRGVAAAYVLFWQIAGLETLEISHNTLKITKTIFGIGRTKEYERNKITSVNLSKAIILPFAFTKFKSTSFDVAITGSILVKLDGRKTEYLGLGLESKQAEKIIAIIQKQLFPNHA